MCPQLQAKPTRLKHLEMAALSVIRHWARMWIIIRQQLQELGQNTKYLGKGRNLVWNSPLIEDCIRDVTSQQRTSCDTTVYSFPSSAYWYLMGGPGPSSSATSMKVAGTPSFNSWVFSAKPTPKDQTFKKKKYWPIPKNMSVLSSTQPFSTRSAPLPLVFSLASKGYPYRICCFRVNLFRTRLNSLPRLAYMTKRLKYCCRWRPCSDTSLRNRLSTARNKWSLRLRLSQP